MVNILGFGSIIAKPWAWPKQLKINKTTSRRGYFTISDSKLTSHYRQTQYNSPPFWYLHSSQFQIPILRGKQNPRVFEFHGFPHPSRRCKQLLQFLKFILFIFVVFVVSLILSSFVKHRTMNSEAIFLELTMPGVQVFYLFIF